MGYPTKVQLIKRKNGPDQWYVNFPSTIAEAMDFSKGEVVEWHIEDRGLLALSRRETPPGLLKKNSNPCLMKSSASGVKASRASGRKGCAKEV